MASYTCAEYAECRQRNAILNSCVCSQCVHKQASQPTQKKTSAHPFEVEKSKAINWNKLRPLKLVPTQLCKRLCFRHLLFPWYSWCYIARVPRSCHASLYNHFDSILPIEWYLSTQFEADLSFKVGRCQSYCLVILPNGRSQHPKKIVRAARAWWCIRA